MWGCGRSPHPHIYPSPLLEGSFFSALNIESAEKAAASRKMRYIERHEPKYIISMVGVSREVRCWKPQKKFFAMKR